jgi:hypothetical protein
MNLDEIVKYINDESAKGELAREFQGIISDFQAGKITAEEKNELVEAVVAGFKAAKASSDEETMRWAVQIATVVTSLV